MWNIKPPWTSHKTSIINIIINNSSPISHPQQLTSHNSYTLQTTIKPPWILLLSPPSTRFHHLHVEQPSHIHTSFHHYYHQPTIHVLPPFISSYSPYIKPPPWNLIPKHQNNLNKPANSTILTHHQPSPPHIPSTFGSEQHKQTQFVCHLQQAHHQPLIPNTSFPITTISPP